MCVRGLHACNCYSSNLRREKVAAYLREAHTHIIIIKHTQTTTTQMITYNVSYIPVCLSVRVVQVVYILNNNITIQGRAVCLSHHRNNTQMELFFVSRIFIHTDTLNNNNISSSSRFVHESSGGSDRCLSGGPLCACVVALLHESSASKTAR